MNGVSIAQTDALSRSDALSSFIERYDIEDENYIEILTDLIDNPIDLNRADKEAIASIPFLNSSQANILFRFIKNNRPFENVNQLLGCRGIETRKLKNILVFFAVNKFSYLFNPAVIFRSRIKIKSPAEIEFESGKYKGSRPAQYNNFKLDLGNILSARIITDKDPGESSFADYYSFSLTGKNIVTIDKIILGDFQYEFGQGLMLWSPYSFGKGGGAVNGIIKHTRLAKPNSYAHELLFFRGVSITNSFGDFTTSLFFSKKKIDGTISEGNLTEYSSGYHRSKTEIGKMKKAEKFNTGFFVSFEPNNNFNFLFGYLRTEYSLPLKSSRIDNPEKYFNNFSFAYKLNFQSFEYSAEWAYDLKHIAFLNSVYIPLNKYIKLLHLFRYYSADYFSPFASGFGENGATQNEKGFYAGVRLKSPTGIFDFYFDLFSFPNSTNSTDFPSSGREFNLNFSSVKFGNSKFFLKAFYESKMIDEIVSNSILTSNRNRLKLRLAWAHSASELLEFKLQSEFTNVKYSASGKDETGYYIMNDIKLKPYKSALLNFRLIYFRTDSFDSRLYEFERDLYGIMTNPALFGEGFRWYILLKAKIYKDLNIELKYSQENKSNGGEKPTGNYFFPSVEKEIFSLQIRCNF